jgi:hypothetical protein
VTNHEARLHSFSLGHFKRFEVKYLGHHPKMRGGQAGTHSRLEQYRRKLTVLYKRIQKMQYQEQKLLGDT